MKVTRSSFLKGLLDELEIIFFAHHQYFEIFIFLQKVIQAVNAGNAVELCLTDNNVRVCAAETGEQPLVKQGLWLHASKDS